LKAEARTVMTITIKDWGPSQCARLGERLERAARLECPTHGQRITAVTIHGRENGWFDSRWTTCCESLEQQAVAIVKERC
jgi:hypothetical protein